jgi:hypothetical protein
MKWLRFPNAGEWAAIATVAIVGVILAFHGGMFSPGGLNAQGHSSRELGGVSSHAELSNNCAACHATLLSRKKMADRCLACHENVGKQLADGLSLHGKFSNGRECRECHTEHKGAHAAITDFGQFDHAVTAFPLTGAHTGAECQGCHKEEGSYAGLAKTCVSCHKQPEVPAVHKSNYGTNCATCHTTATFSQSALAKFDHSKTGFPLTGKHTKADCRSCHKQEGVFKGLATTCVSCHKQPAVPTVHKANYGSNCAGCHTTETFSKPALKNFDHSKTAFPLTGKHTKTDCRSCHKQEGVFKGLATTCVSCHKQPAVPAVHKSNYGTSCANCHTTASFAGAKFVHTAFPMNHGTRKRGGGDSSCVTCHKNTEKPKEFTCYGCHAHTPAKVDRKHARRNIQDVSNCMRCHGRGRKRGRRAELDVPGAGCLFFTLVP